MKLQLPNVTIWGCCWSGDLRMTERTLSVLLYCQSIIECAEFVFFLPFSAHTPGIQVVTIPKLDWQRWSVFVNKEAPKHFKSDYVMCVHEDGFPIDTSLWSPEFLDYDYVGAPWDRKQCGWPAEWGEMLTGNGGFFLQSRSMLDLCLKMPETPEMYLTPSDVYVCRTHRAWFEACGMRFAPPELAARFSTEQTYKDRPSFGFHGRIDSPRKYRAGWEKIRRLEATRA